MSLDFIQCQNMPLNSLPVVLSTYVPRGSALDVARLNPWTWASGGIFMHPLDFHDALQERPA